MNRFELIVDGVSLDTYDDLDISLNYQIDDIQDISKRNTSFSKTISIPGTPKNNRFFKQIFEVNVDKMQFIFNDGKNKFRMSLSREEVMVFTGQIHEYLDNKSEIV